VLLLAPLLAVGSAGPSCDGALSDGLCPDAFSLEETGECLLAKRDQVDDDCKLFIEVNEKCGSHLARCGAGMTWGGDSILCVRDWTKAADLTPDCAAVMAKVGGGAAAEPEEPKEESEEAKKKRAKRKAARKNAAGDVRKLNAENEKKAAKEKAAKEKKAAKKAERKGKSRKELNKDDEDL
jgi:hypothetical protein